MQPASCGRQWRTAYVVLSASTRGCAVYWPLLGAVPADALQSQAATRPLWLTLAGPLRERAPARLPPRLRWRGCSGDACARGAQWEQALAHLEARVPPAARQAFMYELLVTAALGADRAADAQRALAAMAAADVPRDGSTFRLAICVQVGGARRL